MQQQTAESPLQGLHCQSNTDMKLINIEDLRTQARRRLPKVIFDYVDGGAEGEITLRENRRAFEEVSFRPRQAVLSGDSDMSVSVLGTRLPYPAILAPV